jgi:hypothetical protein
VSSHDEAHRVIVEALADKRPGYWEGVARTAVDALVAAGLLRERGGEADTRTIADVIEALGYGRIGAAEIRSALATVRQRSEQASRKQSDG